jgi:hypothetical protein
MILKRKLLSLTILLAMYGSAGAGEWKPTEQIIVTTLLVADWGQTRDAARRDDLKEGWNPILGEYPSTGRVDRYFAATVIGYNIAAYYLPPKWSRRLAYVVGAVQISAVGNNLILGAKFDF